MASGPIISWQIDGETVRDFIFLGSKITTNGDCSHEIKRCFLLGIKAKAKYFFPDSSVGKESACNAGDPGLIPGSGRSSGEEIGYPLQYSWTSLVAQLVKNLPAMRETWVRSLGWEDPLDISLC